MRRTRRALSALVVTVMALGIGANAVVFAVLKAAILNALPYPESERLVAIEPAIAGGAMPDNISVRTASEWIVRARSFDALEAWGDAGVRLTIGGATEMVRGMRVTSGYLDMLGGSVQLGRSLTADDDETSLVVTDGVWRTFFGADPLVVGRTLAGIGGGAYRIVGVLRPDFHPLHMTNPGELPRLFMPVGYDLRRNPCVICPDVRVIARLARGVAIGEAQAEMNAIAPALAREFPSDYAAGVTTRVVPLRDQLLGRFGAALTVAQAVALIFLLLACASVATLLLAHGTRRRA